MEAGNATSPLVSNPHLIRICGFFNYRVMQVVKSSLMSSESLIVFKPVRIWLIRCWEDFLL